MKMISTVVLALVVAFVTYVAGFYCLRLVLRQHLAESFPHIQGRVLSSEVTVTHGSKGGVSYHVRIAYRYTVNGVEYVCYRYRYDGHPNDSFSANAIVSSHPTGSTLDVYYDPHDPANSLLAPGVDVLDVGMSLFIIGIILCLFWVLLSNMSMADWPWARNKTAGGLKLISELLITRVRLPRVQPLPVAILATCILVLLSAAVVGFKLLSVPPWAAGESSLVIAIIVGVAVYVWQYLDVHSGRRDLVIDEGARTVQLPLTYGRREQAPISFSQIRAVFLNKIRHQTKSGAYYTYMVTLEMRQGPEQKLINLSLARAQSLAPWLREKLGVAASQPIPDARAADV